MGERGRVLFVGRSGSLVQRGLPLPIVDDIDVSRSTSLSYLICDKELSNSRNFYCSINNSFSCS